MEALSELFDSKDKAMTAAAQFQTLKRDGGWQLLVTIVNANIKVLEEQLLNGLEDETKESIDRKRDKLKAYKEVIGTPDYWIEKLISPKSVQEDDDPYFTADQMKKAKV